MISHIYHLPFAICPRAHRRRRAFTLTEILVVIVIIVLMLGMAMPVFRFITGGRSEEGAANHIAAMLGRARSEAIGLQKITGVAFILDPATLEEKMAEVEFAPCPAWSSTQAYSQGNYVSNIVGALTYYYIALTNNTNAPPPNTQVDNANWQFVGGPPLDLRADTEPEQLPIGIAVQTITNATLSNTNVRQTDAYLSLGVILFDANGRIVKQQYGIADPQFGHLAKAVGLTHRYPVAGVGVNTTFGVESQFGLVILQKDPFTSQNFTIDDPMYTTASSQQQAAYASTSNGPSEAQEEQWIDNNSTPLLLNRYNGTLIKGE